jgi:signal peptidase
MVRALAKLAEPLFLLAIVLVTSWAAVHVVTPVRVAGWSMSPTLWPGDVVLVRVGSRPISGDIVLVQASGHQPVLHRVVDLMDGGFARTKGDANDVADLEPVAPGEIRGRAVAVVPLGRWFARWRGQPSYATMASQSNSTTR